MQAQETKRRSASLKSGNVLLLSFLLLLLPVFVAGCATSGGSFYQPVFNTAKSEGRLISDTLVTTYPTGTTQSQTGLDTFYNQTICPSSLSTAQCDTNKVNLDTAQFGNFDVDADPIANNSLGIKLVDAVKIDYTAVNIDQSAVTVSGGIVIPEVAPASVKGIILYFHGTTAQRSNVPSNFTTSTNPGDTEGILLAAVWASQGYVVVMPDYIGLGDDTTHAHPYVAFPAQNAQSGLAMVNAARSFLGTSYKMTNTMPMFITGYSEGGAYSLEAAHLMQSNPGYASELNVPLRMAAPLSGLFDLSGTELSYLFDNVDPADNQWYLFDPVESIVSKTLLSTYMILSFADYSGIAPTDIFASPFYTCSVNTLNCVGNLNDVYFTNPQTTSPPYDETVEDLTIDQATLTGWAVTNNSIAPLLTPSYANALMQNDKTNPLYRQITSADTYRFVPRFPVTLVSLEQDSLVTRKNSDVAFAYFTQKNPNGPYLEDLVPNSDFFANSFGGGVGLVDHPTEFPFMSVLILNQFNATK